ncbi:acidic leucine-rich nuclear phosphoprotein 32 family member A isoform X2 [Ochlerotatus camptorhynchus]|uniref:acidic leucine-rich nuclear phosphoprotein 32 family member A isoform X2 n=1 Tax=Ochlerotatus camptorhynchus TaxID=644619 RepID=UPI0031D7E7F1
MEKRIALEKRGLADDKIQELILDNCRSTNVEGLTDSFTALEVLSLINVGLVSLKNFPKLPALRKLELSDNRISNALSHLTGSPKLTHLNMSGNRIKDFEELKPLKDLENLEVLDLFNNEVTMTQNYREKIFELIPSLKYLDGFDKEDLEAPSDEEEADFGAEEEEESLPDPDLDESSDYDDDDDDNDVTLADVYNVNLEEEDGSDWSEEDGEADEDIDVPTDEDEDDGEGEGEGEGEAAGEGEKSGSDSEAEVEAEESEARGKKRKLDGNDG